MSPSDAMRLSRRLALLCAAWLGGGAVTVAAAGFMRELPTPAAADTGESSLCRAADGTLHLTWCGPGGGPGERALRLATLAPRAAGWTEPRTIVSTPLLLENWADFPSLTVASDGALWAQWFQKRAEGRAHGYEGWFARSTDGGATWTKPAPLGHEFVSLAPLSGGRVLAVWLASTRDPAAGRVKLDPGVPSLPRDPASPYHPAMQLRARLLAPDGATLQDWIVDPDTCTCCQTTLAVLPGDRAIVVYRGHTPDEIRDNRVSLFTGHGWTPPRPLNRDGWKIPACPVNGPAVDALGERVAVAWFTAADGIARVQAKCSIDGGLTFGPAIPVDLGRPIGRLDLVLLSDGSAVISWLEAGTTQTAAGLYVRRLFSDGALSAPQLVAATSSVRASGFARLARRDGADLPVVISWTDAVPDGSEPKSPAATRVLTAEFSATGLVREPAGTEAPTRTTAARPLTVIRGENIVFLELCAVPDHRAGEP